MPFTLDALAAMYARPAWRRRNDPTSELVLTILSQNSADINAERAFESLRRHYPSMGEEAAAQPAGAAAEPEGAAAAQPAGAAAEPEGAAVEPEGAAVEPPPGWGGVGILPGAAPDWSRVEGAPLPELIEAIRPGGLAPQKAPRIQASLRSLRELRGDYSLEFLGAMPAREARNWLTAIAGIGRKTASVVLLFCFGTPLMPVDRHVERVSKRVGLLPAKSTADDAHEVFLALLEPEQMYEAHVNLITHGRLTCHARRPACERCAVAPRCRYVDPRAP